MTEDTVPVSEMGIGDDDVEVTLEGHADAITGDRRVESVRVKNSLLDGVAHLRIEFIPGVFRVPESVQNYVISEDLPMFDPHRDDDSLVLRVTTRGVYETWSAMDTPEV